MPVINTEELFKSSKHADAWRAINGGEIARALNLIKPFFKEPPKPRNWFQKLLADAPPPPIFEDVPVSIAYDLLTQGETDRWKDLPDDLYAGATAVAELVRMEVAFRSAMHQTSVKVRAGLCEYLGKLTEIIRKYVEGNNIVMKIWEPSRIIQGWCNFLAEYYHEKVDDQQKLNALYLRGKITVTIMGHYKNLVGQCMNDVGKQLERMNKQEEALKWYDPVIADLAEVETYTWDSWQLEDEENRETLNALLYAYRACDRIRVQRKYIQNIAHIEKILTRE